MSEEKFKNKLVAVLNKSVDTGKVMNALAHMCIGLGSAIGKSELQLITKMLMAVLIHSFRKYLLLFSQKIQTKLETYVMKPLQTVLFLMTSQTR